MRTAFAILLSTLAACRVGDIEPMPLVGEPPAVVAIWPHVAAPATVAAEPWFNGLALALSRRGYRVVAPAVARQLLADAGLATVVDDEGAVGRALRADALLELVVRQFEVETGNGFQSASWDLQWRLVSTRGGGLQWSFDHHGNWRQADRDPLAPVPDLDEPQQPPAIVPIGGNRSPGFRDPADLLAWLHRYAMDRLPERESG